jgi:hypothetical protein
MWTKTKSQKMTFIPQNVPYFKIYRPGLKDKDEIGKLIRNVLLDETTQTKNTNVHAWSWHSYDDSDFSVEQDDEYSCGYSRYSCLGYKYNSIIDDPHDAKIKDQAELDSVQPVNLIKRNFSSEIYESLSNTEPVCLTKLINPSIESGPLFIEFKRAAILTLNNPTSFRYQDFEQRILELIGNRIAVGTPSANFKWVDKEKGDLTWRELELPILKWEVCYKLDNQNLIVTNSGNFMVDILMKSGGNTLKVDNAIDDLTVIRFSERERAFDQVVTKLDKQRVEAYKKEREGNDPNITIKSQEFFSGNISSLLDATSDLNDTEIQRTSGASRLSEKISFNLKMPVGVARK